MATKKQNESEIIRGKITAYLNENGRLLKRLGLTSTLIINFPNRRKPPLLGRLCAWLINLQGGIIDTRFFLRK